MQEREPTEEELREWAEQEAAEKACPHDHDITKLGEDGCVHCGFYAK